MKTQQGTWINDSGEIIKNLEEYEDINDIVEHQVQDLSTSLDSAVNRIDNKIEKTN